jgi:hypothetical protein
MRTPVIAAVTLLLLWTTAASPGAQTPQGAATSPSSLTPIPPTRGVEPTGERAVRQTGLNTLAFDHYHLQPAQSDPLVLRLSDGAYFQVRIVNTDSTQFSYTISAVPDEPTPATTTGATADGIIATRMEQTSVTMRHSSVFARYRVAIALRSDLKLPVKTPPQTGTGAAPGPVDKRTAEGLKLYPAVFDVWVETKPGFEVSFTGGVAFTGHVSPKFFVKTDNNGTPETDDDTKTVEEDRNARDGFRPDTIAMANFRHPEKLAGIGLAVGVGLNNDADPRFFFGPSYFLGRNLLLTTGWSGGRVDRVPNGQELGKAPINGDNTLTTLDKKFEHAFFVGLAFSFIPKSEDNFKGAFGATQKPAPASPPKEEATTNQPASGANVSDNAAEGEYMATDAMLAKVEKLSDKSADITLPGKKATTFAKEGTAFAGVVDGVKIACSFEAGATADGKVVTLTCRSGDKELFLGQQSIK